MSGPFRYDPEDPFGSRPDEKPPAGWQDGFWDGVRERIADREPGDDENGRLPAPPAASFAAPIIAAVLLVTAATIAVMRDVRQKVIAGETPADPGITWVRVSGASHPVVDVEWARLHGKESDYVILRSSSSDIAWVLLERSSPQKPQ